jgi:hypothetical protein
VVDVAYTAAYTSVAPHTAISIPLLVGSYDLEVYSDSGQFPMSSNPKDEITQIGVSFRWNDALLDTVARFVFVNGSVTPTADPSVPIVACKN